MRAEIEAREIALPAEWEKMGIKDRRDVLRTDELKQWILQGKAREGIQLSNVTQIVPESEEMQALIGELN